VTEETSEHSTRSVKLLGTTGIAIGVLSILACELPIVFALVGLGGLSSAASIFSLPPLVELIGITLGLLGLLLVVGLFIYRAISKAKS
jgi:hypothetical protein